MEFVTKMKRILFLSFLILPSLLLAGRSYADIAMASGFGPAWHLREDYGSQKYLRLAYELPTYVYLPIYGDLHARTGLRLAYSDSQPEMPKGISFRETDYSYALEAGIVYDWYVIPSLSFGFGTINRTIKVSTHSKIEDNNAFDRKEKLGFWTMQLGTGIPVARGLVVFEPFYRYQKIKSDERTQSAIGFEMTVQYL